MFPIPNYREKKGKMLLPCFCIKPHDYIKKPFNGKIEVSIRKSFDQGIESIMRVAELIDNKNQSSA